VVDLTPLIAGSLRHRASNPNQCWAYGLEGPAAEYVRLLEAAEDERPRSVNRSEVSRILNGRDSEGLGIKYGFDFEVSQGQVRSHLCRECQCRPT
jgi:hypothetical protein